MLCTLAFYFVDIIISNTGSQTKSSFLQIFPCWMELAELSFWLLVFFSCNYILVWKNTSFNSCSQYFILSSKYYYHLSKHGDKSISIILKRHSTIYHFWDLIFRLCGVFGCLDFRLCRVSGCFSALDGYCH